VSIRDDGVTLAEVLVAFSVLSLLLVVSLKVLSPALSAWTDQQRRSEIGQGLLITSYWLGDDVLRSSPDSLRLTDDEVLLMRCALGQQADHNNEFDQLVAYWREGEVLYRGTQSLSSADSAPLDIDPFDLTKMDSKREVASGVRQFTVDVVQPWRIEFRIEIQRQGRSGELQTSYSSMYAPFDPNLKELQNS